MTTFEQDMISPDSALDDEHYGLQRRCTDFTQFDTSNLSPCPFSATAIRNRVGGTKVVFEHEVEYTRSSDVQIRVTGKGVLHVFLVQLSVYLRARALHSPS
jgi:hypothetical protein